jgi:hypothetical protein
MATNAIITSATLDINKVTFGDIRMNKAGGKSVPIKYNGQNLQIRIPKMTYPMGINIKDTENGTTYQLSATLRGCDPYAKEHAGSEAGETGKLYNFLLDLQEKLVRSAVDNSVKWFGKSRKEDVIRDTMKQFLSPSVEKVNGEWVPSGKYPPSLRMKVPVYDGNVSMDVADSTGKPVEVTPENLAGVFPKRVEASIVVAPSIYVSGQGFGVTWRISYARVAPPQRMTAAQVFADEIEEEVTGTATAPASASSTAFVDQDSEEHPEEVTIPEDTPTAPPAPAPSGSKNRRRVVATA